MQETKVLSYWQVVYTQTIVKRNPKVGQLPRAYQRTEKVVENEDDSDINFRECPRTIPQEPGKESEEMVIRKTLETI